MKLEDTFAEHPKVEIAGDQAAWLYVSGLLYAYRADTDGFVPAAKVAKLTGFRAPQRLADRLVEVNLWEPIEGGYRIHDYLQHQQSSADREEQRVSGARRVALHRDRPLRDLVRERDGNTCRYCGVEVLWTDRRSGRGGTYDHVDPRGGNAESNLVVACRSCNAAKGSRTPEQAGMDLLPVTRYDLKRDLSPVQEITKAEGEGENYTTPNGVVSPSSEVPYETFVDLDVERATKGRAA